MAGWDPPERKAALMEFLKDNKVNLLTDNLDDCYKQIVSKMHKWDQRLPELLLIDFTNLLEKSDINPLDYCSEIYPHQYEGHKFKNLVIPDGVTTIGKEAFRHSLIESIAFPNSLKEIQECAFYSTSLTDIIIPDSVVGIGPFAFGSCYELENVVIGSGLKEISNGTFYNCGITSITIPNNITSIGESAFQECNLVSIKIPDSIEFIGQGAFRQCSFLKSVIIGNGVTKIELGAFKNCKSITDVIIPERFKPKLQHIFGARTDKINFTFV